MNALVTIEALTPAVVFAPGGVEAIVSKLETEVRAIKTDISTESGRKAIGSLAYKVARSKTALDEMGKDLVADLKAQTGKIDAERRVIRDRLEALKDEVRKPLTDWENAEKNRVSGHEEALAAILQAAQLGPDMDSAAIRRHLESVGPLAQRDWQEFSTRATATLDEVRKVLEAALAQATKREAEAAELARLRAEQVAREQKEREERIASEAAERARIAAEAKAKRDADEAAAKAAAEQNRVEQEKTQAVARVARVEREAKEASEKADRDRKAAVEAEQRRHEDAARKAAADAAAREADTKHRAKINSAAVAALVEGGIPDDVAKLAVTLIAKRQIPAVSISY
jgi:hypothetical protein